jgi:radical SAM superfamily enzyme YgiQ (UPF0313 family)
MHKIIPIKKESEPVLQDGPGLDDKHVKIMQAILPYARKTEQKNLTAVKINKITRKSKILFFLLPEWAKNFPPYNLARLLAVVKEAGYQADAVDLNVKAWRDHVNWDIDFDPWHGSKEWRWMGESYHTHLHQHLQPLLEKYIKKIEEDKIDIVGFSLYYCNQEPTDWMAYEIKKRYPHVKILVGGPQCHAFPPGEDKPYYDFVVSGEGEQIILEILEKIENNEWSGQQVIIRQPEGERLDLDRLPWADYSHWDLNEYAMPNGVNAEFSRGCTAKCVFCSETHFWKYRGRGALNTVNEITDLYENHGINFIWFLDSLVNGNLNELRAFCKGIIASGIKIKWTGYARCDKRMDFDYYKDLAGSGCYMLSYGIESGSNKVLEDMDKRVTVDEIEQNLYHGHLVGVEAHCNWIVGFPTEEYQHVYESMTLISRNHLYLNVVAAGHGFTEPPDTILSQNSEHYGLIKSYYQDNWITKDFRNSKVNRVIRLLAFNIFLHNTPTKKGVYNFANFDTVKYHSVVFNNPTRYLKVDYEVFDFNIIKPNINPLADSVVNEIWPMLRLLYRARGGYQIHIHFTPEQINNEFGNRLGCNLTSNMHFSIDDEGNWQAEFDFKYIQDSNAWKYQDYSRETSMSAKRARILAIPGSKGEVVWTWDKYKEDIDKLEEHKKLDFSFEYQYKSIGKW